MMTALASAMSASMTRARRSVQMASFLKPRLCQELVRSMSLQNGTHPTSLDRCAPPPDLGE
jgi:hypothetical protein